VRIRNFVAAERASFRKRYAKISRPQTIRRPDAAENACCDCFGEIVRVGSAAFVAPQDK
jgi:hypothetical protein